MGVPDLKPSSSTLKRPRPSPIPPWIDRVLALLIGIAIVQIFRPQVAAFTTDSDSYLDVAKNLLAGQGLVMRIVDSWRPAIPDPMGLWPPVYSLAIAAAGRFGAPLERAAQAISEVSFVVFALVFHALARRTALGRGGALAVTALALTTTGVARAGVMAWSEMLYLALATGGLIATLALERGKGEGVFPGLLAGLLFGLAATTRTIGLLVIPLGWYALRSARAPRAGAVAWNLGALLPPAVWLIRNQMLFGSPGGPPGAAPDRGAIEIARTTLSGLRWGLLPESLAAIAPVAYVLLALIVVATLLALLQSPVSKIAAGMALVHVAGVAILRGSYMGERFLTPGYPFLWLAAGAAFAARTAARGPAVAWAVRAVAAVLVIAAVFDLGSAAKGTPEDRNAKAARVRETEELRALVPSGTSPILTDEGHRVRHALDRSTIELPGPRFRVREFNADDERRWRAAGLELAVFRRPPSGPAESGLPVSEVLGTYIAGRLPAWEHAGSSASFDLYRLR